MDIEMIIIYVLLAFIFGLILGVMMVRSRTPIHY